MSLQILRFPRDELYHDESNRESWEVGTGYVPYKKGVLKNFAKFPGEHLCQILFFNKIAGTPFLQSTCGR